MQTQPQSKLPRDHSPLFVGILVSVCLHFIILVYKLPELRKIIPHPTEQEITPIEVTEIPPEVLDALVKQEKEKQQLDQQIVETEKATEEKPDENTRFLGEKDQKVKEQTRAKATDDFRKKQGEGLKGKSQEDQPPTSDTAEGEQAPPSDVATGEIPKEAKKAPGIKRDWKSLTLKDLSIDGDGAPSAATDDYLQDVATGDRTLLSTREFRYYSYYNRIKELLRQHWKPNVERKLMFLWESGKPVGEEEHTTKLLVLLDEEGKIQKISRLETSGIHELDNAAIEAFEQAAPFPNPPKGIIDPDGFVRIRWDFILKTEAAPRIQFQRATRPMPR